MSTKGANMNDSSYVNTPSPSSTASMSTFCPPHKYRSSNSKTGAYKPQISSKRRHWHDKLFFHTHSLNRQYIIAMTNVLFQMQKQIYKLKHRTYHVEQMLAKQMRGSHPVIRIPRLTQDDLSTICVSTNKQQSDNVFNNSDESEDTNDFNPSTDECNTSSKTSTKTVSEEKINNEIAQRQRTEKTKYCSTCRREFAHRSAYLRHMRKKHVNEKATYVTEKLPETENLQKETIEPHDNQTADYFETESNSDQLLINSWDVGEGRLRPRPAPKLTSDPSSKSKCDICNKFFRTEYIMKHKRRAHSTLCAPSTNESAIEPNHQMSTDLNPMNPMNSMNHIIDESYKNNAYPPPSAITIADMDTDDTPIEFRRDTAKPIIFATTCLERYQLNLVEEFAKKFSTQVVQTTTIDANVTHLIVNDEKISLRCPVSMKLIEAIASHCYCVSYKWILECLKYDRLVDENLHEILGDDTELRILGGPKRSRLTDRQNNLFKDICFMIKCSDNHESRINNSRLQDLITLCGGNIINCVTQDLLNRFSIVVLCDELYVRERRHNYEQCRSYGIRFVSSDWVLESILEYDRKPFDQYEEIPSYN